jgi:vacuolar-type H+-ATPase catalytic subunit A/Vma1
VVNTESPLSVELGPGLLSSIYDGIQRPLKRIEDESKGVFIKRGIQVYPLDRATKWEFHASVKKGDKVIYSKYAGTEFKLDGEELIIMREGDILAKTT